METGTPLTRAFVQFAGYFNMLANTSITAGRQIMREGGAMKYPKLFAMILTGPMASLWIAEAISIAFRGGPDDEDDDGLLDDWFAQVFGAGTVKGTLAAVPGVGQLGTALANRIFTDNPMDDRASLSPMVSMIESGGGALITVPSAIFGEGSARTAVRDASTLISLLTGIPVYGVARPIRYMAGMAAGDIEPTGPVDVARGLATGSVSPESRRN
jgi:hypothetical protein